MEFGSKGEINRGSLLEGIAIAAVVIVGA